MRRRRRRSSKPKYKIGDEIDGKNFGDDRFWKGEIKPQIPIEKAEVYRVLFDDGDKAEYVRECIRSPSWKDKIEVGDKVEALWSVKAGWYPAKIVRVRRDWIYNVYYPDTEVLMEKTPESNIRFLRRMPKTKPLVVTSEPLKEKRFNGSWGEFKHLEGDTRAILSLDHNSLKMKLVGVGAHGVLEGRAWEGTLKKTNNAYCGELHTKDRKTIKVSGGIYENEISKDFAGDIADIFVFKGQLNEKPFRIILAKC
jgi:hypothetical protein